MVAAPETGGSSRLGPRARRLGVAAFFASIGVNAALGIAALVIGDFSETHGRVLGTSLAVTGALLLALACLPAWERGRLAPVPVLGVALGVVAFSLVVVGIWTDGGDTLGRLMGTFMAPALACAMASLLAYPTLVPRFRPVLVVTLSLLAVAATMLVVAIWVEPDSSWYMRSFGVVAVLLAALAVSIPVLHRIGGREADGGAIETSFCPFCGEEHRAPPAHPTTCDRCGRGFSVRPAR